MTSTTTELPLTVPKATDASALLHIYCANCQDPFLGLFVSFCGAVEPHTPGWTPDKHCPECKELHRTHACFK